MSKNKNLKKSNPAKTNVNSNTSDLWDMLDKFLEKKAKVLFIGSFIFTVLFSMLLFEVRVSLTGDDSTYIIRASRFFHDGTFPTFQGPLYPIILAPFVGLFGINLVTLKLISFVFILGHLYFFYKAFKNNIPATLLYFTMFILSINAYVLYFASQVYNEAFYMMVQSFFFYVFFQHFINNEVHKLPLSQNYKSYLLIASVLLILVLIKNIGYGAVLVIMVYFAFSKQWKPILYTLVTFIGLVVVYELIKMAIWSDVDFQLSTQGSGLMQKNYYDASEGNEDFAGFIQRFADNSNLFISKHFLMFLGFREDNPVIPVYTWATLLVYALFGLGFVTTIKNNKYLLFTALYAGAMFGITFFVLQKMWDQGRLILPFFAPALLIIFAGLYYVTKRSKQIILQLLPLALMVLIIFTVFNRTGERVKTNRDILAHNLAGDITYGFSPDWVNFIKMSKYAAANVPQEYSIASRKPTISFIYGNGRDFHGIYTIPSENADTLLMELSKRNVKYVITASIRKYAQQKTDEIVNTVHRYLYFIQQKYPNSLRLVHKIGTDDQEPAQLIEIIYENTQVPFPMQNEEVQEVVEKE